MKPLAKAKLSLLQSFKGLRSVPDSGEELASG